MAKKKEKMRYVKITRDRCPIKNYPAFEANCQDCGYRGTNYTSDMGHKQYKFTTICKFPACVEVKKK